MLVGDDDGSQGAGSDGGSKRRDGEAGFRGGFLEGEQRLKFWLGECLGGEGKGSHSLHSLVQVLKFFGARLKPVRLVRALMRFSKMRVDFLISGTSCSAVKTR